MSYKVISGKKFDKRFRKLSLQNRKRVEEKISLLKTNPKLGKHLLHVDIWSLRVGKLRVIYVLRKNYVVLVTLKFRKNVYDGL